MKISKREKYLFIFTIVIIAGVVICNFMLGPLFEKWTSLDDEIIAKKAAIKKGLRLLEKRDAIVKKYNFYAKTPRNISNLLSYIEKKAILFDIKTSNIKPWPVIQKDLYKEYVVELQVQGNVDRINAFASELLKSPLFISIKRFDIKTLEENVPISEVKGTITLSKIII